MPACVCVFSLSLSLSLYAIGFMELKHWVETEICCKCCMRIEAVGVICCSIKDPESSDEYSDDQEQRATLDLGSDHHGDRRRGRENQMGATGIEIYEVERGRGVKVGGELAGEDDDEEDAADEEGLIDRGGQF